MVVRVLLFHLNVASVPLLCSDTIRSILSSGENIVMDRYSYSGVAFSAAKGLDCKWCFAPEIGLPGIPPCVL